MVLLWLGEHTKRLVTEDAPRKCGQQHGVWSRVSSWKILWPTSSGKYPLRMGFQSSGFSLPPSWSVSASSAMTQNLLKHGQNPGRVSASRRVSGTTAKDNSCANGDVRRLNKPWRGGVKGASMDETMRGRQTP
jgi:hypothetical protein